MFGLRLYGSGFLVFEKTISTEFKSGEYGGKNKNYAPRSTRIAFAFFNL